MINLKKSLAFTGIFLLIAIGMNVSFLWANTRVFYPAVCLGDWEQPQQAQGEPELGLDDPVEAFKKTNSAVFHRETGSQIFCGEFQGEWPEDLMIRHAKLRLSLAVVSAPPEEETTIPEPVGSSDPIVPSDDGAESAVPPDLSAPPSPSATEGQSEAPAEEETPQSEDGEQAPEFIEEPVEEPVQDEVPAVQEEENTEPETGDVSGAWNAIKHAILRVFQGAVAQEEPASVPPSGTTAGKAEDVLEVSYSFGGSDWMPLAKINHGNWSHATIPLPDVRSLLDLENLQVRLQGFPSSNDIPLVYLDGMELEAEFDQPPALKDRPALHLEDSSLLFSSASHDFSSIEQPLFEVQEPLFTIAEVQQFVQQEKILVLSDRKGRFGKRVFPAEEFVELELPDLPFELPAPAGEPAGQEDLVPGSFPDSLKETVKDLLDGPDENEQILPAPSSGDLPQGDNEESAPPPAGELNEVEIVPVVEEVEVEEAETIPVEFIEPEPVEEADERPERSERPVSSFLRLFGALHAYAQDARGSTQNVKATVRDYAGVELPFATAVDAVFDNSAKKFQIRLEKPSTGFLPGRYTLQVQVETQDMVVTAEQDFTWGVLAINVNKSIYLPGETAYLQMGVVDEAGNTVCDAQLDLNITHEDLGAVAHLSTQDGTIEYSTECSGNTSTHTPDYFGYATLPKETGAYVMELTATTQNGAYTIHDTFEVRSSVPFDVDRSGPSRIFPPADYEVKFKIVPTEDFVGQVRETVPVEFVIRDPHDAVFTVLDSLETKQIVWEVDWKAGKAYELGYTFNAPDVSPYKYLLGPLEMRGSLDFAEIRQWQIAADVTTFITSGTSWTVPSDWNDSNNSIEVIGGGGAGNDPAGGGGGGGYSKITNLDLTPGGSVTIAVGAGGTGDGGSGGDTYFNGASCAAASVCAKGGTGGGTPTGGAGGAAASGVGTTKYSGGKGGNEGCSDDCGGGGGGAGGPNGDGAIGGNTTTGGARGGGGGGHGGGSAGANGGAAGGAGGNNYLGTGGGAANTDGTAGGGGGGASTSPGAGGAGQEWDSTHGSGGGGGGADDNGTNADGNGGLYGGGGGGGSGNTTGQGTGAQGIIVVIYTPAAAGSNAVTQIIIDDD